MKIYLYIIIFLTAQVSFGQVATIQDPDGYANIRETADGQSEIIYKAHQGEVFFYSYEAIDEDKQWIHVYISQKDNPHDLEGFIHISRLLILENAPEYSGKDFYFNYHLSQYDSTNREIIKSDGRWIVTIDGQRPWGIDGDPPHVQVDSIDVKISGKKIKIEEQYFQDIFEVTNSFKVIKTGQYFIVYQMNSDGAGGYDLAWVFDKNGLKQKLVGTMI
jgi:hypothetical protein